MLSNTRLVGRGPQLAVLDAERRRAAAGSFRCVLLTGDAGLGKSRLASEFARRSGRGATRLLARAYPLGETAPLGVWAEAFESHLRNLSPVEIGRISGGFLDDLAGLLRSVAVVRGWAPSQDPPRARLLQGFAALLANLAGGSTVLVVMDDMHLADASSWEALHYLARNLPGARVLLIVIARTAELREHPVAGEILLGLEHDGCLRRVPLSPLSQEAVAELADDVLGRQAPAASVQWLADHSRGNVLFALSLLEALVEQEADLTEPELRTLPETLAETVHAQLRGFDEPAIATLELLAVVGQRVELTDLVSLSARPLDRLTGILHRLVGSRLVVEEERGRSLTYEIAHPLIQQVIAQGVGGARRRSLHRLIARSLLAAGRLGAAAPHFARSAAEGDREAIEALRDAVRQAEQQGAYREALTILNAVVQLLPAGDPGWLDMFNALSWQAEWVVDHRADAHAILGVGAMRELDRVLESSPDPGPRAAVKFRLASFLAWGTGDLEEAEKACRTARDLFEQAGDRKSTLLADNELAWIKALEGEFGAAQARAQDVIEEAKAAGERFAMSQAVGCLGYQALALGRFDQAEEIFERGVAMAREQGDAYRLTSVLSAMALVCGFTGRIDDALALIGEGRRVYPAYGESVLLEWSTVVQWFAGDFPATVATATEVLAWNPGVLGRRRGFAMPFAAVAAAEMGALADAQRYLDKAKATYENRSWSFFGDYCSWAEAVLLGFEGNLGESVELLSAAVRRVVEMGAWPSSALLLSELAETAAAAGDAACAARAAAQLSDVVVHVDRPLYRGLVKAAQGWARLAEGDAESAAVAARAATGLIESSGAKALLARSFDLLGRALVSSDRGEAVDAFGRAAVLFGECGGAARRERAVHVMRDLGSSGRRAAASVRGAGSLTRREREVVQMAAQGYTSREIAEALVIGQRTVETHLSNAYAKLGVDSRAQLIRRASDLGL
jgi:DNA-binding CsgD family transcriptional regulator